MTVQFEFRTATDDAPARRSPRGPWSGHRRQPHGLDRYLLLVASALLTKASIASARASGASMAT
jgi:hypothetical protein